MDILGRLMAESSGADFAAFQARIIKTRYRIIGVKTPNLRAIAKEIKGQNLEAELQNQKSDVFEVVLLQGLLIDLEKDVAKAKRELEAFIPKIDNWAMVDLVVTGLKHFSPSEENFAYFSCLARSESEFEARCGLVGLLRFAGQTEWNDRVIDAISASKCEKYNAEMAKAWVLSEILIKNPQNASKIMQKLVKNGGLDKFTINKTIQKACDSLRLDEGTKAKLKEMRV